MPLKPGKRCVKNGSCRKYDKALTVEIKGSEHPPGTGQTPASSTRRARQSGRGRAVWHVLGDQAVDFNEMLELGLTPRTREYRSPGFGDDLRDAALALERVLAAAHERGATHAVMVLSGVSALLRSLAETENSPPQAATLCGTAAAAPLIAARVRRKAAVPRKTRTPAG